MPCHGSEEHGIALCFLLHSTNLLLKCPAAINVLLPLCVSAASGSVHLHVWLHVTHLHNEGEGGVQHGDGERETGRYRVFTPASPKPKLCCTFTD